MLSGLRRVVAPLLPSRWKQRVRRFPHTARFRLHTWIGGSPSLLFGLHWLLGDYGDRLLGPETELMIEGVPRVASTYAIEAFLLAQGRPVKIASHVHLPAHVLRAVERDVPVLVLIREPRAAVASGLLRDPLLTLGALLERYESFYSGIEPVRDRIVIADFRSAVEDFGSVIEALNAHYHTAYRPYAKTIETEMALARKLLSWDEQTNRTGVASYYPNPDKERAKQAIDFGPHRDRLARCEAIYRRLSPVPEPV